MIQIILVIITIGIVLLFSVSIVSGIVIYEYGYKKKPSKKKDSENSEENNNEENNNEENNNEENSDDNNNNNTDEKHNNSNTKYIPLESDKLFNSLSGCPENNIYFEGLCYTLPEPKENYSVNSPGIITEECKSPSFFDGKQCKYTRSAGMPSKCPDNSEEINNTCYEKAPLSWKGEITNTHLKHNTFNNNPLPISDCPVGKEKLGALCYDKCPAGYTRSGVDCINSCPTDGKFRDDGLFCGKVSIPAGCPPGKVLKDGLCYTINSGEEYKSPGILGTICPEGSSWDGTRCIYSRGAGTIPDIKSTCPQGTEEYLGACYGSNYDKVNCWRTAICTVECRRI